MKSYIAFVFTALLCWGCAPNKPDLPTPISQLWTACDTQCTVDSDCVVLQGHECIGTLAGNKNDLICYQEGFEAYRASGVTNTMKCMGFAPIESYAAVCQSNICVAKDIRPPPEPVAQPVSQFPPITVPRSIQLQTQDPDTNAFLVDPNQDMWQFKTWARKPFDQLGPDYVRNDKPFIRFDARGKMWGHDGAVFFHRTYEVSQGTITLSPDPDRCDQEPCMDRRRPIANNTQVPQSRFLGTYELSFDDTSITLKNEVETVELETFVPLPPLPPIPKDIVLCDIKDMKAGDTIPDDYDRTVVEGTGYIVRGNRQTLMWDHHFGTQGHVEIADGQDIFFEGPDGIKVLRKLTPYGTTASFGVEGLFCKGYG